VNADTPAGESLTCCGALQVRPPSVDFDRRIDGVPLTASCQTT